MTKDFYKYLVYSILLGLLAFSVMQGTLQENIEFAGVANEIGFLFMTLMMLSLTSIITVSELIKSVKTIKS